MSALIIIGLLLIFVFLPTEEPLPIQPVGEQIDGTEDDSEQQEPFDLTRPNGDRLHLFDNLIFKISPTGLSGSSSNNGSGGNGGTGGGGGGGGGGSSRDRTPPTVTGIFSRPSDRDGLDTHPFYTHPFTVAWVGQDERSGIDFCDPPSNYSGPDGTSIMLTGHCTDKAGNVGTGHVTFSYNVTLFVQTFSYNLTLSHNTINLGSDISATAATNDSRIKEVSFVWTDPGNSTKASNTRLLSSSATAQDSFVPDSLGQWRVDAHFAIGTHADMAVRSKSFLVNPAEGGGNGGGNHAPVATNDVITTAEDTPIAIDVLANDSDPDGNQIIISSFTQAGSGLVIANPNGTLTYTPSQNFYGQDSLSYRIFDGSLQSTNNATVTISVTPVNDAPNANAGADQSVNETSQVSLSGALSSDVDGDVLTYSWRQTDGPSANLNNPDTVTPSFTAPKVKKDTALTFELTVTDEFGGSSTDSVKISVLNKNGDHGGGGGDDDCEDRHKHGDTHKHKEKDDDKHKHGDTHKHKDKCDDRHDDKRKDKDKTKDKGGDDDDNERENHGKQDHENDNNNGNVASDKQKDKGGDDRDDDDDKDKEKRKEKDNQNRK